MSSMSRLRLATLSATALACAFGTLPTTHCLAPNSNQINDYHVHMMSPDLFKVMNEKWQQSSEPLNLEPNLNAVQLIQHMKRFNIGKCLVVSSAYLYTSHTANFLNFDEEKEQQMVQKENDYIYHQCQQYPQQLISSFSVHPLKPYSIKEAHRCLNKKYGEVRVCKLHFSNSDINFKNKSGQFDASVALKIKQLFETVEQYKGTVLLHFDNCYMTDAEIGNARQIKEYIAFFMRECVVSCPEIKILFAHLGGFGGFDDRTANILDAIVSEVIEHGLQERIYFDISSIFFKEKPMDIVPAFEAKDRFAELLKRMERNGMLGQLVYGSDYPWVEHEQYLQSVKEMCELPDDALDSILKNVVPIFC